MSLWEITYREFFFSKMASELKRVNHYRMLLQQYREYLSRGNYARRTVNEYPGEIVHFLTYMQDAGIEDIKAAGIKDLLNWQLETIGMAPGTQCGKLAMVKNFFRFQHKTGKIYVNPAAGLEAPRRPKRLPTGFLDEEEIKAVLDKPNVNTFVGVRDKAMLELLYSTGLRNFELRNLKPIDLDMDESRLVVEGKGSKEAWVPFGREACKALIHYLEFWRPKKQSQGPWVFISRWRGTLLDSNDINRIIREYVK